MEENSNQTKPAPVGPHDRKEILRILALAVVSFVAGFALIFFLLKPDSPKAPPAEIPPAPVAGEPAPAEVATPAVEPAAPDAAVLPSEVPAEVASEEADTAPEAPDSGNAAAEVPPGKTPGNIAIDGDIFYLKCWDASGVEHKGADCDKLDVLEKRFATRLYVIEKCRSEAAPKSTEGKLSVASEVDFSGGRISFWSGPSSDIAGAQAIGQCLRTSLAGLPIHGITSRYTRYRIFFPVVFGKPAAKPAAATAPEKTGETGRRKGRTVEVVMDKVRVRRTPVDGEIIGRIGKGNQVTLINQKDGWCNVITPGGNEGWMTCDALAL
jgi:hypothetical protein